MPISLTRLLSPWIVGTVLGTFYFALGMAVPQYRSFQEDSERLLAGSAKRAANEGGVWQWGGFMHHAELKPGIIPESTPYYSQFCLHFKLLAWVTGFRPHQADNIHLGFQFAAALLVGFLLAWFVAAVHRDFGPLAALIALLLVAGSSPLIAFASKFYWLEALLLLPFVFSFASYERLRAAGHLRRFYGTIGLLIFVKSLCGYEYLSSILLSAMAPLIYREMAAGSPRRLITRRMALTFAAGVVGFAAAYAATFAQAYFFLGSAEEAFRSLFRSAGYNTLGDHLGREVPVVRTIARFFQYFLVEGQWQILVFTAAAFVFYWAIASGPSVRQWGVTLAFALIASISWNALAHGHMRGHIHINFITFYIPFNLMAYAFIGMVVQKAMNARYDRP